MIPYVVELTYRCNRSPAANVSGKCWTLCLILCDSLTLYKLKLGYPKMWNAPEDKCHGPRKEVTECIVGDNCLMLFVD